MKDDGGPERVGTAVQDYLKRSGLDRQVRRARVVDDWEERVGEGIARVTRARSVSDATLFVEVATSAWLMELDLMKGELLRRINEGREGDEITRIVFVLGGESGG